MIATAIPRVRISIPSAVMRYKNNAGSPYATIRALGKKPLYYVPTLALGLISTGVLGPGPAITAISTAETAANAKKIVTPKAERPSILRASAMLGLAVGGFMLHLGTGLVSGLAGLAAVTFGLITVGVDKVVRMVRARKSVKELKLLVNRDNVDLLREEMEKQQVSAKLQRKLLRKLGIREEVA